MFKSPGSAALAAGDDRPDPGRPAGVRLLRACSAAATITLAAVPAVGSLFSTHHPQLVIGCTSDEAAAVVPIINKDKTVMFCMTGQSEFDHVKYPYFYRLVPPDLAESYAMTMIAKDLGYKRIALAFGNDIGSQTFVQPRSAR